MSNPSEQNPSSGKGRAKDAGAVRRTGGTPSRETHRDQAGRDTARSRSSSLVGVRLGKYEIESRLGQGGMGAVWKAKDGVADRYVVIKTVPKEVSGHRKEMARVKANFQQIHELQHQNICPVYDLGFDKRCGYYLVMKFIDGQTLGDYRNAVLAKEGSIGLDRVMPIIESVATALDYAHSRKVIHRDIKLDNIMVTVDGDVQVVDFGIAAEIQASVARISQVQMGVAGTPAYMAPEQWKGEFQDGKTDQYALAIVAYELFSGRLPFDAPNIHAFAHCAINEPMPAIDEVSAGINAVLSKALAKDRADRFENCTAFAARLDEERLLGHDGSRPARLSYLEQPSVYPIKSDSSSGEPASSKPSKAKTSRPEFYGKTLSSTATRQTARRKIQQYPPKVATRRKQSSKKKQQRNLPVRKLASLGALLVFLPLAILLVHRKVEEYQSARQSDSEDTNQSAGPPQFIVDAGGLRRTETGERLYSFEEIKAVTGRERETLPPPSEWYADRGKPLWEASVIEPLLKAREQHSDEDDDSDNGPKETVLRGDHPHIHHVAISPGGNIIAAGDSGGTTRAWEFATGRELWSHTDTAHGNNDNVLAVGFSADGKHVFVCYQEMIVKLDAATGLRDDFLKPLDGVGRLATISADGSLACISQTKEHLRVVHVYDLQRMRERSQIDGLAFAMALDWNNDLFLSSMEPTRRNHIVNLGRGHSSKSLLGSWFRAATATFSTDGAFLAVAAFDPPDSALNQMENDDLVIWQRQTSGWSPRSHLATGKGWQWALCFSPDAKFLLTGGRGSDDDLYGEKGPATRNVIQVWDLAKEEVVKKYAGHNAAVLDIEFTSDGRYFVTSGADGTVRIWEYDL